MDGDLKKLIAILIKANVFTPQEIELIKQPPEKVFVLQENAFHWKVDVFYFSLIPVELVEIETDGCFSLGWKNMPAHDDNILPIEGLGVNYFLTQEEAINAADMRIERNVRSRHNDKKLSGDEWLAKMNGNGWQVLSMGGTFRLNKTEILQADYRFCINGYIADRNSCEAYYQYIKRNLPEHHTELVPVASADSNSHRDIKAMLRALHNGDGQGYWQGLANFIYRSGDLVSIDECRIFIQFYEMGMEICS